MQVHSSRSPAVHALQLSFLAFVLFRSGASARAEGTAQLGVQSKMEAQTVLFVDILANTEGIFWNGAGTLTVTDPAGVEVVVLSSGQTAILTGLLPGPYAVKLNTDQTSVWQITVTNPTIGGGRLYSTAWTFLTGTFAGGEDAQNTSYYALMPGGSALNDTVSEMKFVGLQGNGYTVSANATGVNGSNAGRSVPVSGNTVTPDYPIYLNPPTIGHYNPMTATLSELRYAGGPTGICSAVIPGSGSPGNFEFTSDVTGTYQIICDLNRDTVFDRTSSLDLLLIGPVVAGPNLVPWDGTDESGVAVPPETYECKIVVNVGELHFVGEDIETAYKGLRMFNVPLPIIGAPGVPTLPSPLTMFWNDELVLADDVDLPAPTSAPSLATSGPDGMSSGLYTDAIEPNINARSWGNFSDPPAGKGNASFLDTFSSTTSSAITKLTILAINSATDSDLDGLTDFNELCVHATNPNNADTDGGGVPDGVEVGRSTDPNVSGDDQVCGDGYRTGTEACDDGDGDAGVVDGCSFVCTVDPGWTCVGMTPDVCSTTCGDGIRAGVEACDDGDLMALDGCGATCTVETGWTCNGLTPDVCTTACGDGVRAGAEACDDHNLLPLDGCSPICAVDNGWTCSGLTPDACVTHCGDGVRAGTEACDDGMLIPNDGCGATCTVESGWSCSGVTPDTCSTGCGDGLIRATEGCDDDNASAGDGCSASCQTESGYICSGEPSVCSGDIDGDGITNALDNCPTTANPDQTDTGAEGTGDSCRHYGVSGGGCSTDGTGAGSGLLALAFALAFATRRARNARLLVAAAILAAPLAAHAQVVEQRDFPIERFHLSTDRAGLFGVEGAALGEAGTWDVGLWMGDANDPLVVYRDDDGTQRRTGSLIETRVGAEIVGSYALFRWLAIGVELPLVVYQDRNSMVTGVTGTLPAISGPGLGDLRLSAKLGVLREASHGLDLALVAQVTLPSGEESDYRGDSSLSFAPELAIGKTIGQFRMGVNAGYLLREPSMSTAVGVDDELILRVGGGLRIADPLELAVTLSGATAAASPFDESAQNHLEVIGGPTLDVGASWQVFAAGGAGLDSGYGTPDWRVLAGIRIGRPRGNTDRDHDGIVDRLDRCPELAEDLDGFQDGDGCPDIDNDLDGVLDVNDRCRDQAEDSDGFEDENGCPDPDNDADGIADANDRCVNEPETLNGFEDSDGCPDFEPDRDHDGIVDAKDRCPDEAEDKDGFQDDDGCADGDNDGDHVADLQDPCPLVAGPVENRGCPDTDRDGDRVVDRLDNCPDLAGTVANRGCTARQLVALGSGRIDVLDVVNFRVAKADIEPRSLRVLDAVAAVLKAHTDLVSIEIQGHTDDVGDDTFNRDLSQRRAEAVRAYLVKQGIAEGRLIAVGFGETAPLASNGTTKGRATNRRVVFKTTGGDGTVQQPTTP